MKFKNLSEVTANPWRCEFHYPQSNGSVRVEWVDPVEVMALQARVKELEAENAKLVRMHENDCHFAVKVEEENARLRSDLDSCSSSHQKQNAYVEKLEQVVDAVRTARWHPRSAVGMALAELDGEKKHEPGCTCKEWSGAPCGHCQKVHGL